MTTPRRPATRFAAPASFALANSPVMPTLLAGTGQRILSGAFPSLDGVRSPRPCGRACFVLLSMFHLGPVLQEIAGRSGGIYPDVREGAALLCPSVLVFQQVLAWKAPDAEHVVPLLNESPPPRERCDVCCARIFTCQAPIIGGLRR